jgi:hypothetical protein
MREDIVDYHCFFTSLFIPETSIPWQKDSKKDNINTSLLREIVNEYVLILLRRNNV